MINNIKKFFKLMLFEVKRIIKSPIITCFLILGPILVAVFMGIMFSEKKNQESEKNIVNEQIVFVAEDSNNIDTEVLEVINYYFNNENVQIQWGQNLEEQLARLRISQISLVVYVQTTQTPNEIIIINDPTNILSSRLTNNISSLGYQYSYISVKDFLQSWFINIDDELFNLTQTQTLDNVSNSQLRGITTKAIAVLIAFLLVIGVAYSMARDNETGVIKQLSYTPMSAFKYINIRSLFFILIGTIQSIVMFMIFCAFGVPIPHNILMTFAIMVLFVVAFVSLSLLLSTAKNQISTMSVAVLFIVLPTLIASISNIYTLPSILRFVLYLSPLTPFMQLFTTASFYGVIDTTLLIILVLQSLIYYSSSLIILKRKTGQKIFKKSKI